MVRFLLVLALVGLGLVIVALGGKAGPFDLTRVPLAMIAFALVCALVLLGLRRI
jgi:hypothetical protein